MRQQEPHGVSQQLQGSEAGGFQRAQVWDGRHHTERETAVPGAEHLQLREVTSFAFYFPLLTRQSFRDPAASPPQGPPRAVGGCSLRHSHQEGPCLCCCTIFRVFPEASGSAPTLKSDPQHCQDPASRGRN